MRPDLPRSPAAKRPLIIGRNLRPFAPDVAACARQHLAHAEVIRWLNQELTPKVAAQDILPAPHASNPELASLLSIFRGKGPQPAFQPLPSAHLPLLP